MLQRTPTYILPQPGKDPLAVALRRLPTKVSYPIVRSANIAKLVANYQLAQRLPDVSKKLVRRFTERQLPEGVSYDEHFQPPYNVWDQRLCVVPNSDLFRALRSGKADVVTDTIETFTADRHPARRRARSSRPTSSSARPASSSSCSAASTSPSTASRSCRARP